MNVPKDARVVASLGLLLHENGFAGGTEVGWERAVMLSRSKTISKSDVKVIRDWFARHRHVSRVGFFKWLRDGAPLQVNEDNKNKYRGAVAWMLWGGEPMYAQFF